MDGPPFGIRAARRGRGGRVPGRPRAHGHGRRAAVDPGRPRRPDPGSAWVELRKASWIINGYLLVYILTMPMAGRLADLWGARRLFLGALVVFIVGSALAGASQTLDQLIAARLVQAVGGGVLVPVGTAVASHLFGGATRPRALGVVGALTFLGMAAGPVVGAAILASVHPKEPSPRPACAARPRPSSSRPGGGCSTSTSPSGSSRSCSRGPPRPTGKRRTGRADRHRRARPTASPLSQGCSG